MVRSKCEKCKVFRASDGSYDVCACACVMCVTYVCCGPQVNAVRVYVNSSSENLDYPVLVVVRQQKEVLSWQVPLLFQGL